MNIITLSAIAYFEINLHVFLDTGRGGLLFSAFNITKRMFKFV